MAAPPAWAAAPPGWSQDVPINDGALFGESSYGHVVAVHASGKALAAWTVRHADLGLRVVMYAWYTPGQGWSDSEYVVDYCAMSNTDAPAVAVSAGGTFQLVWADHDTAYNCNGPAIWTMRWEPQAPATPAEIVGWGNVEVWDPKVGLDDQGNAVAVWLASDGLQINVSAARYTPGAGWGSSAVLDNQVPNAEAPRLAVDPTGDALAVWRQRDGVTDRAYANRFTVAAGWQAPQTVDAGQFDVDEIELAMDGAGRALIAFDQTNATRERVYVNRYLPGTGWAGATVVSGVPNQGIGFPSVACNGAGDCVVSWIQHTGLVWHVFAASYFAAAGWSPAENLTAAYAVSWLATSNSAAITAGGARFVMATAGFNSYRTADIFMQPAQGSWGHAGELWNVTGQSPRGLYGGGDDVVAFSLLSDGIYYHLHASVYTPPDVTAPSLAVAGPADGSTSPTPTVLVYGTVETGATLWVNHVQVESVPAGPASNWSVLVALVAGSNTIVAYAVDAAGNDMEVTVAVVYSDPVPALNSQIAAANAQLADTQADLAAAQSQLASTQASLAAAQGQITMLQGSLAAAQANQTVGDAALQGKVDSAAASAGTAVLVGLLGLLVGAAGIAMGFMMSRKRAPTPPGEPPKAP